MFFQLIFIAVCQASGDISKNCCSHLSGKCTRHLTYLITIQSPILTINKRSDIVCIHGRRKRAAICRAWVKACALDTLAAPKNEKKNRKTERVSQKS